VLDGALDDGPTLDDNYAAPFEPQYIVEELSSYGPVDRVVLDSVSGLSAMGEDYDAYRRRCSTSCGCSTTSSTRQPCCRPSRARPRAPWTVKEGLSDDRPLTVGFDSLTPPLEYNDVPSTHKFRHVFTGRLAEVNAVTHFRLDPNAFEDKTVHELKTLVDHVHTVEE